MPVAGPSSARPEPSISQYKTRPHEVQQENINARIRESDYFPLKNNMLHCNNSTLVSGALSCAPP
jgi:hypothetical protein